MLEKFPKYYTNTLGIFFNPATGTVEVTDKGNTDVVDQSKENKTEEKITASIDLSEQ